MGKYITTNQEFTAAVTFGATAESRTLEFKQTYDARQTGYQSEIRKDLLALANTDGGCLLIGVSEVARADGKKVAGDLVVVDVAAMTARIGDVMKDKIHPVVRYEVATLNPPNLTGSPTQIMAVNVYPHEDAVGCYLMDDRGMGFPYRDDFGVKMYSIQEATNLMFSLTRRAQVLAEAIGLVGRRVQVVSPVKQERMEADEERRARVILRYPNNNTYTGTAPPHLRAQLVEEPYGDSTVTVQAVQRTQIVMVLAGQTFAVGYTLVRDIWEVPGADAYMDLGCDLVVNTVGATTVKVRSKG